MPNIKSAIKRVKTNDSRRLRNANVKSNVRTSVKVAETALAGDNAATAKEALLTAAKKLDKAASKGLIHKNAAARKKSRLTKRLNSLNA
ncbi:30S ribosomal protein S20 [Peribacillus psychrosaccharolyticus]|jgi:small subunit ribosomal protein S20|uniref:Small ribosomal subunit protein bS20 n=1 Tax=Peribacillus psychrosaccharolyticus TaxID=1407 RepID=A0A974NLF3_PERPY|nr:30S ribosomal protein S20 [Peribacillus psychrosaccharolyticus]MEC2054351.1 30S ribosomal protein S20 [Peribacillus psychrosaccharolyticus]MED3744421.1 30S ribosomal protein S20 [Peribacillus psychrosaccharolyticus]QQS99893.1 30S ribosomal protein S20 [Peribacillus psychrosaccharolyticus]